MIQTLKNEKPIIIAIFVLISMFLLEHTLLNSMVGTLIGLGVLFGAIIYSAMGVAHHAEVLAIKLGPSIGTLILTLSAALVEILMIGIMLSHTHNPELPRDTIFAAVMLDINFLLGVAAIIGGLKFGEQPYNMDSSNSYLSMIIVSMGIAMILPDFLPQASYHLFEGFILVTFVLLYMVFTRVQLKEHKYFFEFEGSEEEHHNSIENISITYHAITLAGSIALIGFMSELLSIFLGDTIVMAGLPVALGAFSVAIISASPELITAVRSASANKMQIVINIALGASLATVLLTIPAMIVLSKVMGFDIVLGLSNVQILLFALTMIAASINLNDGETNALEGFVFFILFVTFVFTMFI